MDRFAGRRVLVTGAASGIGQAIVLRMLAEGARVVGGDVAEEGLKRTLEQAGDRGQLHVRRLDVADEASVTEAVEAAAADLGGLDVLVNAAGILRGAHTHECSLSDWNEVIAVNLTGTFLTTRAALPALLKSGRGVVVNFSSTAAQFAHPFMAAYSASKGGVLSFTHAIAQEYGRLGLRAVSIMPGGISSGITDNIAALVPQDVVWSLF